MLFRHVGLACSSEDNADRFYRDLLGLNKSEPKILGADLSRVIFNVDCDLQLINYMDANNHFEIFVSDQIDNPRDRITHQCLEVENLPEFTVKCRAMGVEVNLIPKGDKTLTFIKDFDGNQFELI